MKYLHFHALFFLGLVVFTCGNGGKQEKTGGNTADAAAEEKLWDEVMAVHDEVMPKMSTVNRLSRELRASLETGTAVTLDLHQRIEATVGLLEKAEEGMWEWMNNLKQLDGLRETMDHTAIITYLQKEKESIGNVRQEMLDAIAAGEKLMGELNPEKTDQKG